MDIIAFRDFCMKKDQTSESFPFDQNTLVFKVAGKMFALCDVDEFESINLKCNPERAIELRTLHPEITPGYHMNKAHWNTIDMHGHLSDAMIVDMINHSYELVVLSLPKRVRETVRI